MRKKAKQIMALCMVLLLTSTMFAGCGKSNNEDSSTTKTPTNSVAVTENPDDTAELSTTAKKVGVVIKIAGNPFYAATDLGFAEAGEELGIEFITNGPSRQLLKVRSRLLKVLSARRLMQLQLLPMIMKR